MSVARRRARRRPISGVFLYRKTRCPRPAALHSRTPRRNCLLSSPSIAERASLPPPLKSSLVSTAAAASLATHRHTHVGALSPVFHRGTGGGRRFFSMRAVRDERGSQARENATADANDDHDDDVSGRLWKRTTTPFFPPRPNRLSPSLPPFPFSSSTFSESVHRSIERRIAPSSTVNRYHRRLWMSKEERVRQTEEAREKGERRRRTTLPSERHRRRPRRRRRRRRR